MRNDRTTSRARRPHAHLAFLTLVLLLAPPLLGQSTSLSEAPPPVPDPTLAPPTWTFDLERSSHIVRPEEERVMITYTTGDWRFGALIGTVSPFFQDDRDQLGVEVGYRYGRLDVLGVVRQNETNDDDDTIGSVRLSSRLRSGARAGIEATFASADLVADGFLVDSDPVAGRVFWERPGGGLGVEIFFAESATFDLKRGTDQLLRRLPRSELVGVETLADLDPDEARVEDSVGARVRFGNGQRWRASVYLKSGEQILRGLPENDDFTGFGGELEIRSRIWGIRAEADLRQLDFAGGFGELDRGRVLIDVWNRIGRFGWALGGYVQGEAESFQEIVDVYDTAGVGARLGWHLRDGAQGERSFGLWAMFEEDTPDFQEVGRFAVFYQHGKTEYAVGLRSDEIGRRRFREEETGPLLVIKRQWGGFEIDLDLSVVDGEAYGRLALAFRR